MREDIKQKHFKYHIYIYLKLLNYNILKGAMSCFNEPFSNLCKFLNIYVPMVSTFYFNSLYHSFLNA